MDEISALYYFWPDWGAICLNTLILILVLRPIYTLRCFFIVLFAWPFISSFTNLLRSKWEICFKIKKIVFLTWIFPKLGPFYSFVNLYDPHMPYRSTLVVLWYCFPSTTIFTSIFLFTMFQMENWHQDWQFCTLDLNFVKFWPYLHFFRAVTTYMCLLKCMFGIYLFSSFTDLLCSK